MANVISGTEGPDTLLGTAGDDQISAGGGADSVSAGEGSDTVMGGQGADTLDGGAGVDWVSYALSTKPMSIGIGTTGSSAARYPNDAEAGDGRDVLRGFENVEGSAYEDGISGNAGPNVLRGLAGSDSLNGGAGADTLIGGDGYDYLVGGEGDDVIDGGLGSDLMLGDLGRDTFVFRPGDSTIRRPDEIGGFERFDWLKFATAPGDYVETMRNYQMDTFDQANALIAGGARYVAIEMDFYELWLFVDSASDGGQAEDMIILTQKRLTDISAENIISDPTIEPKPYTPPPPPPPKPLPTLTITGPELVAEGSDGSKSIAYTVTPTGERNGTIKVDYAVVHGETDAADFNGAVSGTLTISTTDLRGTISIPIASDKVSEHNESFRVVLSNPQAAVIADGEVETTLTNDDGGFGPEVRVLGDVTSGEPDAGVFPVSFTLQRNSGTGESVVGYSTTLITAEAADFKDGVLPSGVVTFAPGEMEKTIRIFVAGDREVEGDETYRLDLTSISNADVEDRAGRPPGGTGTIRDNDAAPVTGATGFRLATDLVHVDEGDSGVTPMVFEVTRSGSLAGAATVAWSTDYHLDGVGAPTGDDFPGGIWPSGTLAFADGEAWKTFTIPVVGDTVKEETGQFEVFLTESTLGTVSQTVTLAYVMNDDTQPPPDRPPPAADATKIEFATTTLTKAEGNAGVTDFTYTLTRSGSTAVTSTVDWRVSGTHPDPASVFDFAAVTGQVTFAPGETSKTITVQVLGDGKVETDENFRVNISDEAGHVRGRHMAAGVIANDDGTNPSPPPNDPPPSEPPPSEPPPTYPPPSDPPPSSGGQIYNSPGPGSTVQGGAGDDTLNASQGADQLTGGGGADVFAWAKEPWSPATVHDFVVGTDRIDLSALFRTSGYAGSDPVADKYVTLLSDADGTKILFDRDGTAAAQQWPNYVVLLKGLTGQFTWAQLSGGATTSPPLSDPPPSEPSPSGPPPSSGAGQVYNSPGPGSTVTGGTGDDTLNASQGADVLTGGAGADAFAFKAAPWSAGRVTDFMVGTDRLDLSGIFQASGYAGADPIADGRMRLDSDGASGTKVYFDKDAPNGGDWPFLITTLEKVSPAGLTWAQLSGDQSSGGQSSGGQTSGGEPPPTNPPPADPPPASGGGAGQVYTSPAPGSTLTGGAGDDTLNASQGPDRLTGAGGADHFAFRDLPWNAGHVTDFTPGVDKLDLRPLFDASPGGKVEFRPDGAVGTEVYFDKDGAGGDWPFRITVLDGVTPDRIGAGDWLFQ